MIEYVNNPLVFHDGVLLPVNRIAWYLPSGGRVIPSDDFMGDLITQEGRFTVDSNWGEFGSLHVGALLVIEKNGWFVQYILTDVTTSTAIDVGDVFSCTVTIGRSSRAVRPARKTFDAGVAIDRDFRDIRQAILDDISNRFHRLALADWFEEHASPLAEFHRWLSGNSHLLTMKGDHCEINLEVVVGAITVFPLLLIMLPIIPFAFNTPPQAPTSRIHGNLWVDYPSLEYDLWETWRQVHSLHADVPKEITA